MHNHCKQHTEQHNNISATTQFHCFSFAPYHSLFSGQCPAGSYCLCSPGSSLTPSADHENNAQMPFEVLLDTEHIAAGIESLQTDLTFGYDVLFKA